MFYSSVDSNSHVLKPCYRFFCFLIYADNFPPNITARSIFRIDLNMESVLYLEVVDTADNFTLSVEGGLPHNSTLESISQSDANFIFRWTLHHVTYDPLIFLAVDSRGASTTFTPTVEICACVNGGICSLDGVLSNNATVVMNCQCTRGMTKSGDGCNTVWTVCHA